MRPNSTETPLCEVQGCDARVHGRGLCRVHYDESRYLESTGQRPEAQAAAQRESSIDSELRYGSVAAWRSPHGTTSMFASEEEHRDAWDARREELLSEYLTPPSVPGRRPAAWWRFEARRPEHLRPYPLDPPPGEPRWGEAHGQALDSCDFEPILYLAANGHLFDDEVEAIRERGREAAGRIGTDREQRGSTRAVSKDRSKVRLARAVDAALAGKPDDGPDYGVGRGPLIVREG
jgi:hypothetical protein